MTVRALPAGISIALLLGAIACGSAPAREKPAPRAGWAACYGDFTPSGNARADLIRLTRSCGVAGGMRAITPVRVEEQADGDPVDRYTFFVPYAGSCYRVFAVGGRGVEDLDLLLRGPEGEDVVADLSHDPFPVLPPNEPICIGTPGLYQLEVSVFRGSGRYAVQVWGS